MSADPHPAPDRPAPRRTELRTILGHAGTVLVGQLASMAFGVTDTLVAGHHAETSLAALSVGAAYFVSVFVGLMGVMQALLPVWGELNGAGRTTEVGRALRQALYLCIASIGIGMFALLSPGPVLRLAEVPEALQGDVRSYLQVLAWSLPPALLFRLYSTFNQGLGRPQLVTWLQAGALLVKIPLSIWFAFGGLGLPAGGATGCAWATLVVTVLMLITALWLMRTQSFYRPFEIWRPMERPDGPMLRQFMRLGIPAALAIMVEVTSFTLMALFIARLGTAAAGAHQIAANVAAVLYMVPLSLGIAVSARVSFWLGAGDPRQARATIRTGFRLAWGAAAILAALLFALHLQVARLYGASAQVTSVAAVLLAWVACYHLADTTQALSVFILRCYRVTVAPLALYSGLLWGGGLGGGFLLAYRGLGPFAAMESPKAFWIASTCALAFTAVAFVGLLWRTATRAGR